MPRYYVKNPKGKWNIYSTIIDGLLFDDFISYDDLCEWVLNDIVEDKKQELLTLLTDKPKLNVMSYQETMEELKENK